MTSVVSPTIGGIGRVSETAAGVKGDSNSGLGRMVFTADGSQVAFTSISMNLNPTAPLHAPADRPILLKDLYTGELKPAFLAIGGALTDYGYSEFSFSADGTKLGAVTRATNLIPGSTADDTKLVVFDVNTGSLVRADVAADGKLPFRGFDNFSLSADGQRFLIKTTSENLVAEDIPWNLPQIFVKDVVGGAYQLASSNAAGVAGNRQASDAVFSRDGNFVAFTSLATNLVADDTNFATIGGAAERGGDVFVKNLSTGEIIRASTASDGSQLTLANASHPVFSADGTRVLFDVRQYSSPSDTVGTYRVMEKNLVTGELIDVFVASGATPFSAGPNDIYSWEPVQGVSDDFSKILFTGMVSNLPGYVFGHNAVYVLDRNTGTITYVISDVQGASISPDGSKVVVVSDQKYGFADDGDRTDYDAFVITLAPSTVAVDDRATAVEDGAPVTIDVLANDLTATTGSAKTLLSLDTTGLVGTASIVGGKVVYDPGVNFQSLKAGQTTTTDFNYSMRDAEGLVRTGTVTLTIQGTNDVAALTLRMSVAENTEDTIYGVSAVDPDGDTLTMRLSGPDAGLFNLNTTTGDLTFRAPPDFEAPGDVGADNTYNVTITVSDGIQPIAQNLVIRVTNLIYENTPPVFTSGTTGTIAENATGVVYTAAATDDGDAVAQRPVALVYGIEGADASKFNINTATGAVSFIVAKDFETPDDANTNNIYDITVTASDGSRTARQAVSITVTDVYENTAPFFSSGTGASFAENGSGVVYTALVYDTGDAAGPITGDLSYLTTSLATGGTNDNALFALDALTGGLTFIVPPDFENPTDLNGDNVYVVVLEVTDGPDFTVTRQVSITVADVYENTAPVITNLGPTTFAENATGTAFSISATDNGGAAAAGPVTITYSISGVDAALFTMNATTGRATFINAPDFEIPLDDDGDNVYDVVLSASDGSLTSSINRSITVTDVNVAPVLSSPINAIFAENDTGIAYAITYTDDDDLAGATHVFAISGADASLFSVDASTGEVLFVASPNFEAPRSSVYSIVVSVSDVIDIAGAPTVLGAPVSQDVYITVTNVNEGLSILSAGTAAFTENMTTPAYTVIGLDIDADTVLNYSIAGTDAARFTINSATGAVHFVTAPDFETPLDSGGNNVYDIVVSATDGEFTETQAVAITVGNVIEGGAGSDTITGSGGADTIDGGAGQDAINGSGGNDIMLGSGGNDNLNGAAGADSLVGGEGNDQLSGGTDSDTLAGGVGNDTMDGGTGVDSIAGGVGDDVYYVDNSNDRILELNGEGTDQVFSTATYILSNFLETLVLRGSGNIDGTGNDGNNTLTGNAGINRLSGEGGHDRLDGGIGADVMLGGAGNDIYFVDNSGDTVIEFDGDGADQVYSSVSYTLSDFTEALFLRGTDTIAGTGNAQDNTLSGNVASNTLSGGVGNDRLDGGAGADSLVGGVGNDIYFVDTAADAILELNGEGSDQVASSVSYTLVDFIEVLSLTGTANINGTGSAQNNSLVGNGGANALDGADGNDTLNGGAGNDTLTGGAGNDSLLGGTGSDVFLFRSIGEAPDRVADYNVADDSIQVSAAGFGGPLTIGIDLVANNLYVANAAGVATVAGTGQFVFDTDDRILWWDANGTDAGGQTAFATILGVTGFVGSEIQVIA
jgi:Ca2+-binding RTX toxin-like protein